MQVDQSLQLAGLNSPAASGRGDPALQVASDDAAATGAQLERTICALDNDSTRAICQFDIAGFWHCDIQIDAAQTKLEEGPKDATGDIQDAALLAIQDLHVVMPDSQPAGTFSASYRDDALLAAAQ